MALIVSILFLISGYYIISTIISMLVVLVELAVEADENKGDSNRN